MTSLYNNIEVGDTISFPRSFLAVKEGVIASITKRNQHALFVTCTNGAKFEVSKHSNDYVLTVEDNN